jgi:energy-coupling factor transporter ATP-binding protein EcfA2
MRLRMEAVTFHYPATAAPALRDVSLDIGPGEVIAVVGNVGAGASTLLLVAAGLAPRVTGGMLAGRVEYAGGGRGLLLPTPWTQVSGMAFTAWDEVAFGPANLGWPLDRISGAVDRALAAVEITALAARDPATLSGGELQRVILAGVLAMEPDLLLLDEPTAELDPAGAGLVWRLVRGLAARGTSVVVASSDLDAVPEFADRVVWLERGVVRRVGPPGQVLADDAVWVAGPEGPAASAVWRAAGLPAPYPLTVRDVVARCP